MSWPRRLALALPATALLALGPCRALLPEWAAVNAPLSQMLFGTTRPPPPATVLDARIRVPAGFSFGVFAQDLPGARFLRATPGGDLLVSQPRAGRIALLERDADGDGRADAQRVLLEGLNRPHGLDLHDGWLYVGETDAVARVRFDPRTRTTQGPLERIVTGLPAGGNHWTRTLRIGPDGKLYVSVGSSCNACEERDPRRAALLRFDADGGNAAIHASGLRNAVGFDWQPGSGELYATDNGRDLLGDDFPPCELNRVVEGGFYGWPYAVGANRPDPDYGPGNEERIRDALPPAHAFRAHNAPLGISFVRGTAAPAAYRGAALVALHGSWNRTRKDGYKVVSLHWRPDGSIEERDFVTGFLLDEDVIGRPVDVAEGADGAFYVSDDYAGAVYRVAAGASPARVVQAPTAPAEPPPRALVALDAADAATAATAADAERGRALYETHACFACHEPSRAEAGALAVELTGLAQRYDANALTAFLAAPTPPMPLVALTPAERRDLAAYLLEAAR